MTLRLAAIVVLLLPTLGAAQAPLVSPAFFADVEGPLASTAPLAGGRSQQVHADLRGTAFVARGLAFRRDGIAPDDPRQAARDVVIELRMADANLATLGAGFAANYVGAPTVTLPATTVRLPDRSVRPSSRPAPVDVTLPFAVPFAYTGLGDLLWESIVTRAPSTPYTSDLAESGNSVTPASVRLVGTGCVTGGSEFRFDVTADTQTLSGRRPQVAWIYQATGVPAYGFVGIAFGLGDPALALPGVCGLVRVQSFAVLPVVRQPGGIVRAVQTTPLSAAPVGVPFELQAVAAGPGVALSNGVTVRVNPVAPAFAISRVLATDPAALRGTLVPGVAAVVGFLR